jgi:long-chain acyl-CoA synthetase
MTDDEWPWLSQYPPGVPHGVTFPKLPLSGILDDVARRHGRAPALVFEGQSMSWLEVRSLADRFGASLYRLGVGKGDRVVLLLPNVPHFVVAYYAVLKLGAVIVPANPLCVERELELQVRESGAKVIVTLDVFHERIANIAERDEVQHIVLGNLLDFLPWHSRLLAAGIRRADARVGSTCHRGSAGSSALKRIYGVVEKHMSSVRRIRAMPHPAQAISYGANVHRFRSLFRADDSDLPAMEVGIDDLAVLLRTGGTTGAPRAAMLTHGNLIANACQMRVWFPDLRDGKETILAVLPFFHAFGLTLTLNAGLMIAARLVLVPRFVLGDVFQAIDKYRPSVLPGVPPLFAAMADGAVGRQHDLHSIRLCVSGGAALPPDLKERFEAATGAHLYQGYGLTEASPATHCTPYDGSGEPVSIGLPLPGTNVRIVDETDCSVPAGHAGELLVRGPQVMRGYWRRPRETAAMLHDGWLRTGDVARMDEKGFFFILDRKKDVIKVAGESVYPNEIEELILQHPKVRDAGVAGIPHPLRGEVVTAFVVLRAGETASKAELVDWLHGRLARFKIPRVIEFRTELPKNALGKVLRRELAAEEEARLSRRVAREAATECPVDDLFSFSDNSVDFMSAESFPASDPPPSPLSIGGPPNAFPAD